MEIQATGNTGILMQQANTDIINDQRSFGDLYIASRAKEQRLYSDRQLSLLPAIDEEHMHYIEWKIRSYSASRLRNYLSKRNKNPEIMEIGCGNGWLAAFLSTLQGSDITAIDINEYEINQAKRVFGSIPNIQFQYRDIGYEKDFPIQKYDVILFAASIQYFASVRDILSACLRSLKKDGEIHIMDSFFYGEDQLEHAKNISKQHYQDLGFAGMDEFYFHHSYHDLKSFNYKFLSDPSSLLNRFRKKVIFPWIKIKH